MVINQWVPAAHRGDAIGDSARRVRALLRHMGYRSELYAHAIDDDLAGDVRSFDDPTSHLGDVTIFHFALSSPLSAAFAALPRGRVLQYHNITPARFFAPYDPGLAQLARIGRDELASLAGCTDLALGVSEYNRRELEAAGFRQTGVMPLALDLDRIVQAPRLPSLEDALDDGRVNFLFVGRIAPNKCIEDYVCLARLYERYIEDRYRFIFVGRTNAAPAYYDRIWSLIGRLRMKPDRFLFTGVVSDAELAAYYRSSSVYVSLSEHEGFCAPLLEAMAAGVPVLAYAAAAVPETLGGAGVQFAPKDLERAAELLDILAFDDGVRTQVVAGQRLRLADFGDDRLERDLRAIVDRVAS